MKTMAAGAGAMLLPPIWASGRRGGRVLVGALGDDPKCPVLERPNLVFVFPDQFRRHCLGFMGQDPVRTPNLDAFAANSVVFTHAVSNCPICSPFRGMLMTGKYPFSSGITTNCCSGDWAADSYLKVSERTIADVLSDNGYWCGYIGKWHLDRPNANCPTGVMVNGVCHDAYTPEPQRHGFSFWHAYGNQNRHHQSHYWIDKALEEDYTVIDKWSPEYETDTAIAFIQEANMYQRPFALFVAMNPPHPVYSDVPLEYTACYRAMGERDLLVRPNVDWNDAGSAFTVARKNVRFYFGAVTGIDEQFGRILACLEEEGLAENTIVVFTSDHGDMMGSHRMIGKNVWYDESIGIPFLIRWPGHLQPGYEDLLFNVPDIMPTLLGLMGLEDQIPACVEGVDRSGLFGGSAATRPVSSPLMYVVPLDRPAYRGIRTHQYLYVVSGPSYQPKRIYLYNLEKDPFQMTNLAQDAPVVVDELQNELDQWAEFIDDSWRKRPVRAA